LAHGHGPSHEPLHPRFRHDHFYVAPYYGYYYPGWPTWPGWNEPGNYPLAYGDQYGDDDSEPYVTPAPGEPSASFPTDDMLAAALPEGVLQVGGSVEGFLYFQRVDEPTGAVQLQIALVDASIGQPFGDIAVPLQLVSR
jgi:hypothetical protein